MTATSAAGNVLIDSSGQARHVGHRDRGRQPRWQVDRTPPPGGTDIETEAIVTSLAFIDPVAGAPRPRVLCVDDDRDIGETVQAILADEGYDVTCLFEITDGELRRMIDDVDPDCVLLDSSSRTDYGDSWLAAAWIGHRAQAVPVVMFSAHLADSREALANLTERAQEAGFAAVLPKPFSIDELLDAVSTACAVSRPRPRSSGGSPDS